MWGVREHITTKQLKPALAGHAYSHFSLPFFEIILFFFDYFSGKILFKSVKVTMSSTLRL